MKQNMGTADKTIRILIAAAIGVLLLTDQLTGVLAWILGLVAAMFLITSIVGVCPLYTPFKLSTLREKANTP